MLMTTARNKKGGLQKMQLAAFPECALFSQEIEGHGEGHGKDGQQPSVVVRYHPARREPATEAAGNTAPTKSTKSTTSTMSTMSPVEHPPLRIPLEPCTKNLARIHVDLHTSPADAYRMGAAYDDWFSACFGFDVVLVFLGDGRRRVLGETLKPKPTRRQTKAATRQAAGRQGQAGGLLGLLFAYLAAAWWALLAALGAGGGGRTGAAAGVKAAGDDEPWITFADCAPFLVTSESSLADVNAKLSAGVEVPMYKFRPNLVVDGAGEAAWAEDFWGEVALRPAKQLPAVAAKEGGAEKGDGDQRGSQLADDTTDPAAPGTRYLLLTSNCARCTSLNVDYGSGARAAGDLGEVLKRLSSYRRVDPGTKYSPVFGRYAFLDGAEEACIAVGDEAAVTQRNAERTVWDWPFL